MFRSPFPKSFPCAQRLGLRPVARLLLGSAVAFALTAVARPLHAAGSQAAAAPAVPVQLNEADKTATLSNGRVTLVFQKDKAALSSLTFEGKQLIEGGYVQIAFASRHDHPPITWQYRVVRRTPELVEIAFVNVNPKCPFEFESHYILRAGESGVHTYLVWGHDAAAHPEPYRLAQYNFALRVDPAIFNTAAVDDERIVRMPDPKELTRDRTVMDSTYLLPDGSYFSKYFLAAERDEKHTVHGAMGHGLGVWIIMPSDEHLNGGPEHQELTVHPDGSIVLLAHAQGAHYGAGMIQGDARDGSWRKASAVWFIYANSGGSDSVLWGDAKHQAAEAVAAWPYRWLDDATFQLHRGDVAGRLTFSGGAPVAGARVILADHERTPGPLLWQQQWRGYRFYTWADAQGNFDVTKVRTGLYDLYAFRPGSFGVFMKPAVKVGEGQHVDLGQLVWQQPAGRTTLWQIGTPDHSAREFGFAENFRTWGLWRRIADATGGKVNYQVGRSGPRDWPFEMALTQSSDKSWCVPSWNVQFNSAAAGHGKAVLRLGIAAYEGKIKPQLLISLNGKPVGSVGDLQISGAAHRSGIHAAYQEREITFDASLIHAGQNTLTLAMPAPTSASSRDEVTARAALLWDSIRLEVER